MPVKLNSTGGGSVTLTVPATASDFTQTLPAGNGTILTTAGVTTPVEFAAGTAALPSITTTGDTNTGLYFPAADTVATTTGGTERMRVDSSGNVGIGTSSPGNKLDIVSAGSSQIRVKDGVNATAYYDFGRDGTDGFFGFSGAQTTFSGYKWSVNAGSEVMRITNGGNVGIGTSSGTGKIQVVLGTSYAPGTGWSTSTAVFGGSTSISGAFGIAYDDTNGAALASILPGTAWKPIYTNCSDFIVKTNGTTEAMRVNSSGNFQFNSGYGSVATAYGCRAWVNFNGTGTVAIRASGNVTSITDNGTGEYTLNFTTALPDANYSIVGSCGTGAAGNDDFNLTTNFNAAPTTTAARVGSQRANSGTATDAAYISVAIFR